MTLDIAIKSFEQLSKSELYALLQARVQVFVVEQKCPYQDIDGVDDTSLHALLKEEGELVAYLRIIPLDNEGNCYQIGRVLTLTRGKGHGFEVMAQAIEYLVQTGNLEEIVLEAQSYAIGFYEKLGFHVTSEEFLEDGIPHVEMKRQFV